MPWRETVSRIVEDLMVTCGGRKGVGPFISALLFSVHFQVLCAYRLGHCLTTRGSPFRFLNPLLRHFMNVVSGCYVEFTARIGRRVRLAHPTGIVIGADVVVEDGVIIYQQVTLGSSGRPGQARGYPTIGRGATLYAGCVVIGPVHIGPGATVGALSVVLEDVPAGATAVGSPARILPAKTGGEQ